MKKITCDFCNKEIIPGLETVFLLERSSKEGKFVLRTWDACSPCAQPEVNVINLSWPRAISVPVEPGEGWEFVEFPKRGDQYWLHGQWIDFTPENCNRDFICGEVGASFCQKIRRKILS